MSRIRVAVLRGGPRGENSNENSKENEISLKTGATVLSNIPADLYEAQDIFISKEGKWHKNGLEITPHNAISHTDIVFNALHGQYGEDGKVQHILEMHKIPFTGSGSFASALSMNKVLAKEVYKREGIKTPQFILIKSLASLDLPAVFRTFAPPVVLKPVSLGSSLGVAIVPNFPTFEKALTKILEQHDEVMIEEYIPGVEASVGVIDGYRDQEIYALPPIEIREGNHTVPGNFSQNEKIDLENLARKVHQAFGLKHYSRTDFIVSPKRGIFVLEINTQPSLAEESLLTKALYAVGSNMSHFIDHVLQRALNRE